MPFITVHILLNVCTRGSVRALVNVLLMNSLATLISTDSRPVMFVEIIASTRTIAANGESYRKD